jgi:arylamine N-acetyltransferase
MGIQRPDGGRVTLQDDVLRIIQSSDKAEERILQTPEDFKAALEEYFGIRPITS